MQKRLRKILLKKKNHDFTKDSISSLAMSHKKLISIKNISLDKRIFQPDYIDTFIKILLIIPVKIYSPIGAIGIYWDSEHEASESEKYLITFLAISTASALDNLIINNQKDKKIKELIENDKNKELFLMTVSHEIQTPVAAVQGWIGLLKDKKLFALSKNAFLIKKE